MESFNLYTTPPSNEQQFEDIALSLFRYQYKSNHLYQTYVNQIGKKPDDVKTVADIPFLPIRFFKSHRVVSGEWQPQAIFTSSATTGTTVSHHYIKDAQFYLTHAADIFEHFYGNITDYHFLALLPSYVEREGSSLIAMINYFIAGDITGESGYFLNDDEALITQLIKLKKSKKTTLLWGVSFALLDLAEKFELDLSHCIVMETGGMKGRRKEWVRGELHSFLCKRFNSQSIHSEYGMTELMSQGYSQGGGYYSCPAWMKILIREINDPFSFESHTKTGGINVIDLANTHSCAFIETEDLGRLNEDLRYEVLGRIDNSDMRGCNLLLN
ncbi:MAG: acyl transferase [Bacteroidetes bacterium]|nr:acyl transferase [Bacteroidota bacterium]MBS1539823.1 acyl transferase [Bacteroidota bacterium]